VTTKSPARERGFLIESIGSTYLPVQKCCRREDAYAVKRIERQQIEVAGNDCIGAAVYGSFEELIVARVAANADGRRNRDLNRCDDELGC
jgi:hypothetical protein